MVLTKNKLIEESKKIIATYDVKLTLRQLYYRLVSAGILQNLLSEYKKLSRVITEARKKEIIDPMSIEDRTRIPHIPQSWTNLQQFLQDVKTSYAKASLYLQKRYVEVWIEKDALSNVFLPICNFYDVPLIIGRGYASYTAICEAQTRILEMNKPTTILYFGDFDPSGEDIVRYIKTEMPNVDIQKIALTEQQIKDYKLLTMPAKKTDNRSAKFISKYGDCCCVELDALDPKLLQQLIIDNLKQNLDENIIKQKQLEEKKELQALGEFIDSYA